MKKPTNCIKLPDANDTIDNVNSTIKFVSKHPGSKFWTLHTLDDEIYVVAAKDRKTAIQTILDKVRYDWGFNSEGEMPDALNVDYKDCKQFISEELTKIV